MTPADALMQIRYDQKSEQYKLPSRSGAIVNQILQGDIESPLFQYPWPSDIRRAVRSHWESIHDDVIFRYSRACLGKRYNASKTLSLLCHLLQDRIERGFHLDQPVNWKKIQIDSPKLVVHTTADFTTTYNNQTFSGTVSGQTRIVCNVRFDNRLLKVFDKFITHPFFQYSNRKRRARD